jgi:hypothetical protein
MDTLWRCTVCGQVGTVGRCCGNDTREPLNDAARAEQLRLDDDYIDTILRKVYRWEPDRVERLVARLEERNA